jgi:ferredoxin/coenzyme F420-reducing hydrogenase delta subunit
MVTDRVSFDEIRRFLHSMAHEVKVIVSDDLCQTYALRHLIEREGLRPVVVGACSELRPKPYVWEDETTESLNPQCTATFDLLKETGTRYSNAQVTERIKLLLWAQITRARDFKEVSQHNLSARVASLQGEVSRRELASMLLPHYEIVPFIEPSKCVGGTKCKLCQGICPLKAISIEENTVTIDKSMCSGCGACVAVCPHGAISYPTFSLEEVNSELEGLLLREGVLLDPRIIALTCQCCFTGYAEDGKDQLRYPLTMLPLTVPSLAMASPWLMLSAFYMGAQGLALIAGNEKSHPGIDKAIWQDNVRFTQELLDRLGIGGQRVRVFDLENNNKHDAEQELERFASLIEKLGPTPFKEAEHISPCIEGQRLTALIKDMGSKLAWSLEGTISMGNVPLGTVELDATKCTGCGLCALNCPTDAITILTHGDGVNYELLFQYDSCVACGMCINICPENSLTLEHILDLHRIGGPASVLFHDSMVLCRRCSRPVAPKSMLDRLSERLRGTGNSLSEWLDLCPDCKIETQRYT